MSSCGTVDAVVKAAPALPTDRIAKIRIAVDRARDERMHRPHDGFIETDWNST